MNCSREKRAADRAGQRLDGEGLGDARDALEQAVALREQADHHPLDQALLADDHPLDLEHHPFERRRVGRGCLDVLGLGHGRSSLLPLGRTRSRYGTSLYGAWVSEVARRAAAVLGEGLPGGRDRRPAAGATRSCTTRRG